MGDHLVARAWSLYKREGLLSVVRGTRHKLITWVPFEYRVRYRTGKDQIRYGPKSVADPFSILWIDPTEVEYLGTRLSRRTNVGTVQGGEWDREPIELAGFWMAQGLEQRFVDGRDWEETIYYERSKDWFDDNGYFLRYDSFSEFESHRLPYLDELYNRIESEGYKTQSELAPGDHGRRHENRQRSHYLTHEIGCNIARDGRFLLNSGVHRLTIAKILGLAEIPIQVIVRHEQWQDIRQEVSKATEVAELRPHTRAYTDHPDLQSLIPETWTHQTQLTTQERP